MQYYLPSLLYCLFIFYIMEKAKEVKMGKRRSEIYNLFNHAKQGLSIHGRCSRHFTDSEFGQFF